MGYALDNFNGGFETFCVEYNEHFTPGSTLYYGISQGAINGGISGGNPDPISKGTAWLYLNSLRARWPDTTTALGPDGNASAAALQATIWWLEGEGANPNNRFDQLVMKSRRTTWTTTTAITVWAFSIYGTTAIISDGSRPVDARAGRGIDRYVARFGIPWSRCG